MTKAEALQELDKLDDILESSQDYVDQERGDNMGMIA